MKLLSKHIFSSCALWLIPVFCIAQTQETSDSTTIVSTTIKNPERPGFHFTVDAGKLSSLFTDFEEKYDVSVGYLFSNRLAIEVEGGLATLNPNNAFKNGTYESSGTYFKAGIDYFLPNNLKPKNNIAIGFRYAIANFEDNLSFKIGSDLWKDFGESFQRTDLSANWYEIILTSENNVTGNLFVGAKVRLRVMSKYDEQLPIDVWAVPGYGRTFDDSVPAFNLYIKYRFAF